MLTNHTAYKYEITYKIQFTITRCFIIDVVSLQCGATQIMYNIRLIKPYKSDTNI